MVNQPADNPPDDGCSKSASAGCTADAITRRDVAGHVPFFLRAWWLRDRKEYENIVFGSGATATMPLWCLHSDPLCDASNIDSSVL